MDKMETLAVDMASVHPTVLMSVPRVFNKIYEKIHSTMRETGGMKLKLFNTAKALAKKKRETGKSGLKLKILDKLVFGKIRHMFGNQLELGLTASAKMNPEIAEFFYDVGIPTYDCYGLTETSPAITMNRPNAHKLRTVGQVLEKITVIIDKSQTGEQSEDGEILIWGPNVMMGYLNKPDKTKEMMTEDGKGIRTGDLGHFDKEGYLYITGRIKEQYKLENGKYCFPNEVEEQIKLLPYISNVMVFGDGKPYNVALAVLNIPTLEKFAADLKFSASAKDYLKNVGVQEILGNEIQNALKGKFGGYEIPRKFVFITEDFTVENGMLTQTMKLKRRNVMKQYGDQLMALYKA
jgi:long-chain acyl-CoA synthetase